MPFVKIDTGILDSTLWDDVDGRNVFLTAVFMAVPRELTAPMPELRIDSTEPTGWQVPPGWYGFVPAAGPRIVHRSGLSLEAGMAALARQAAPDPHSGTPDFDGRRLVREDGGYIVLNFMLYRERDYTTAQLRSRSTCRRLSPWDSATHRTSGYPSRRRLRACWEPG